MSDLVGQQLGNYRLIQQLGSDDLTDIYQGEHIRTRMTATIKVFRAHLAGEDATAFQREAQKIAELVHPNIVRIQDFDVQDGIPFLVFDYLSNDLLRQRHPRGSKLSLSQSSTYVKQIAKALQYAHDRGIIHRNIRPENLLLGSQNEILVAGFGNAMLVQAIPALSGQSSNESIYYMAPEQIQSNALPASDQYALGAVIYEWLSGELPFQGPFDEVMAKQLSAHPPLLREKAPEIPEDVEQIIMTALAKDPRERFNSVQALSTAFEHATTKGAGRLTPEQISQIIPDIPTVRAQQPSQSIPAVQQPSQSIPAGQQPSQQSSAFPVQPSQPMPALPPRSPVPGYGAPPFPPQAQRPAAFMPVPRPPQFLPHMFPASLPAQKHGGFLQGLLFGVILVAIAIAWFFLANFFTGLFFISLNISFSAISIFTTVIALIHIIIINGIVYFCAGIFGAKRTGRVSGGVMTSLWSCLWFIIGTIVIEVIAAALTIADLSKRFPAESTNFAQEIILTNLFWLVIFFIISVGVSAGLGALGGLIGRGSAHKHQPPMMPPMPQPLPPSAPQR